MTLRQKSVKIQSKEETLRMEHHGQSGTLDAALNTHAETPSANRASTVPQLLFVYAAIKELGQKLVVGSLWQLKHKH